jgi:hypothetical protein
MAEGVERESNLITRYTIFEKIYIRATLAAEVIDKLRDSLVNLYAVVLEYLCRAQRYYGHRTAGISTQPHLSLHFSRHADIKFGTLVNEQRTNRKVNGGFIHQQNLRGGQSS